MIRYAWNNIKNSVKSRYFLLGVLILTGIFFCSGGKGLLCVQVQEKPLIIQEIFRYSRKQFEQNIMDYSAAAMFKHGMEEFMYLVMPMAGIGYLLRFCDERYGGYDRLILARIGKKNYFAGTLLTSAGLGILTVLVSGALILGILYAVLPSGAGVEGVLGLEDCIRQLGFACILAIIGNWLGFLVAVVAESRFLSLVMPVLVFEIWTEMCMGARMGNPISNLNLKQLFDPLHNGTAIGQYVLFAGISLLAFGGGFYLIAVKKLERGR